MPIAKLKYLVANGNLATGNFMPCFRINFSFLEMFLFLKKPRSEQMAGGCRKLHNDKLHNLY
jgi:hypothetical protein